MSGYVTRDAWREDTGEPLLVGRNHRRGHVAAGLAPGGQPYDRRLRRNMLCPWCGARPGESCFDARGGYPKRMKGYHDERRLRRQPAAAGEETS